MGFKMESLAVKKYKVIKDSGTLTMALVYNEINFLRELKLCENIVQLQSVYINREDQDAGIVIVSLVMKLAKYGSLLKHLHKKNKFSEEQIRTIMAQLILAVDLMHRNNIIHRDIKPDNILLVDKD